MKFPHEIKQELLKRGIWRSITRARTDMTKRRVHHVYATVEAMKMHGADDLLPILRASPRYKRYIARVRGATKLPHRGFCDLKAPRETFEGKDCSEQEAVRWVADNLAVEMVNVEHAPSARAWGLLNWVRQDTDNEKDFWKSIYPKLAPPKSDVQIEASEAKTAGKTKEPVVDIIERFERAMQDHDDE